MSDEELDEIKQKKKEEMQKGEQDRMQQQMRGLAAQLLDEKAYSRLMFVAQKNPQLYANAIRWIASMAQGGQLKGKLGEDDLKGILFRLAGGRRDPKITFKRKGE